MIIVCMYLLMWPVSLQDNNWRCTNIPKLASSNLCTLQKLEVLQVNDALWCHPKEVPNHFHGPFSGLCPDGGMTSRSQFKQLSL